MKPGGHCCASKQGAAGAARGGGGVSGGLITLVVPAAFRGRRGYVHQPWVSCLGAGATPEGDGRLQQAPAPQGANQQAVGRTTPALTFGADVVSALAVFRAVAGVGAARDDGATCGWDRQSGGRLQWACCRASLMSHACLRHLRWQGALGAWRQTMGHRPARRPTPVARAPKGCTTAAGHAPHKKVRAATQRREAPTHIRHLPRRTQSPDRTASWGCSRRRPGSRTCRSAGCRRWAPGRRRTRRYLFAASVGDWHIKSRLRQAGRAVQGAQGLAESAAAQCSTQPRSAVEGGAVPPT